MRPRTNTTFSTTPVFEDQPESDDEAPVLGRTVTEGRQMSSRVKRAPSRFDISVIPKTPTKRPKSVKTPRKSPKKKEIPAKTPKSPAAAKRKMTFDEKEDNIQPKSMLKMSKSNTKPIREWTAKEVRDHVIKQNLVETSVANRILKEKINGMALLLMTETHLQLLNLRLGDFVILWSIISKLQEGKN